jgi:hypothetical protein
VLSLCFIRGGVSRLCGFQIKERGHGERNIRPCHFVETVGLASSVFRTNCAVSFEDHQARLAPKLIQTIRPQELMTNCLPEEKVSLQTLPAVIIN